MQKTKQAQEALEGQDKHWSVNEREKAVRN